MREQGLIANVRRKTNVGAVFKDLLFCGAW